MCGSFVDLTGHSIGAFMASRLLFRYQSSAPIPPPFPAIIGAVLLFPTFCHIGVTPNGLRLTPVLRYYQRAASHAAAFVDACPVAVKAFLGVAAVGGDAWRQPHIRHAFLHGVVDGDVAGNALFMADEEMETVGEPDDAALVTHQSRLAFVYAPTDGWVHDGEAARVSAALPGAHVSVVGGSIHAFVLQQGDAVAVQTVSALQTQFRWT